MAKRSGIGEVLHEIREEIGDVFGGGTVSTGARIAESLACICEELRKANENNGSGQDIAKALEGIRQELKSDTEAGDYEYEEISNGPVEVVLAFNNDEFIKLLGPDHAPYFSSHGPLTDLQGNEIPGSKVATTFPVDPSKFGETGLWPPEQVEPFDEPPTNNTNTTGHGYSKQAYYFNNDKDWFVTIGPSLPKIVKTKDGGAQFWVGSIGVIAQGQGRFAGARGVTTYVGSAYLDYWPDDFFGQIKILREGFKALIGTFVKVVLAKDQAQPSGPPSQPDQPGQSDQAKQSKPAKPADKK
jgi:hypothetical protein